MVFTRDHMDGICTALWQSKESLPWKSRLQFLEDWYFFIIKNKTKTNKLFLYWFIMCVCMSPFAHVKVRGQLARVSSAIWVLWTALSGLVAWAFAHWVISLAFFVILSYVYKYFAYIMCKYYMGAWCLSTLKSVRAPGAGVRVGCEPQYGYWELSLDSLQEQQVLVTNCWAIYQPQGLPSKCANWLTSLTKLYLLSYFLLNYIYYL